MKDKLLKSSQNYSNTILTAAAVSRLEGILLDLNIGRISVKVAKSKILKLIENENTRTKT